MRKYIGTKLVEAEPAWRLNGKLYTWDALPDSADHAEAGYRVRYPDGYESWSPWAVFEAAYLRVNPDGECKTGAPSVSPGMVEDFLRETWTETLGEKTTVVRARLRNGFEIVESSSCVSPENYDEAMGREICLEKIRDKVWELLGFLLQTAVNGINAGDSTVGQAPEAAGPVGQAPGPWGAVQEAEHPCGGNCVCAEERRDFGWALRQLRHGGAVRRRGWNGRGICILLQVPDECSKMTQPYIYIDTTGLQTENPAAPKGRVPWLASQTDMLAEDWEIVE